MSENPLIISIESSGATSGVVLSEGTQLLAEYSLFGNNLQDKLLAELCHRIMKDCNKNFEELDAVAVSAGPGSFTGLRIGASVAKGICFGTSTRCISVPTLSAFAFATVEYAQSLGASEIIAVIPSNQNLFFYQKFDSTGNPLSEIQLTEHQEIQPLITHNSIVCGTAAYDFQVRHRLSGLNRLTPRFTARLAAGMWKLGNVIAAEDFLPLYSQEFRVKTK